MGISNLSTGLRPGVCTSTTRPSTPFEGQMIYETDTNRVLVYEGAAWVMIADTDTPPALELVKVQTVGSAVASVTVNDVFSSTYDNYRIVISNVVCSTTDVSFTLKFSGSTGNTYAYFSRYDQYFAGTSGVVNGFNVASILIGWMDANAVGFAFDVFNPNLAKYTYANSSTQTRNYTMNQGGVDATTNTHTGFTLATASGNVTGGTIRVYGYRNTI